MENGRCYRAGDTLAWRPMLIAGRLHLQDRALGIDRMHPAARVEGANAGKLAIQGLCGKHPGRLVTGYGEKQFEIFTVRESVLKW